jgi:hypothetical protein
MASADYSFMTEVPSEAPRLAFVAAKNSLSDLVAEYARKSAP